MDLGTLETLLLEISDEKEDRRLAEKAFVKIYREYAPQTTRMIKTFLNSTGFVDQEYLDMIINNTFCTVFKKPLSFKTPKGAKSDSCFKNWLCQIAKNEFYTEIRKLRRREELVVNDPEFRLPEIKIDKKVLKGANGELMSKALNTLSERDRAIMVVIFDHYVEGKNTPSDIIEILCQVHNIKKPHLRKIKERSIQKIIDYIEKHSSLKAAKHA